MNQQAMTELPAELVQKVFDFYGLFVQDILGLLEEKPENQQVLLNIILSDYAEAKAAKNYGKVDAIRAQLKNAGITVKDMKTGISWAYDDN
jgi:cysteinyl-tRNA synthetase